jgi:hypothetical protein
MDGASFASAAGTGDGRKPPATGGGATGEFRASPRYENPAGRPDLALCVRSPPRPARGALFIGPGVTTITAAPARPGALSLRMGGRVAYGAARECPRLVLLFDSSSTKLTARPAVAPPFGLSATRTFMSEQISHQQPANNSFLSEQTSIGHRPPAKRTSCLVNSFFWRVAGVVGAHGDDPPGSPGRPLHAGQVVAQPAAGHDGASLV